MYFSLEHTKALLNKQKSHIFTHFYNICRIINFKLNRIHFPDILSNCESFIIEKHYHLTHLKHSDLELSQPHFIKISAETNLSFNKNIQLTKCTLYELNFGIYS